MATRKNQSLLRLYALLMQAYFFKGLAEENFHHWMQFRFFGQPCLKGIPDFHHLFFDKNRCVRKVLIGVAHRKSHLDLMKSNQTDPIYPVRNLGVKFQQHGDKSSGFPFFQYKTGSKTG